MVAALPPTPPPAVVGGGRGPRVSVPLSVQPHPSQHPVVATCGLEGAVRVWEPTIRGVCTVKYILGFSNLVFTMGIIK